MTVFHEPPASTPLEVSSEVDGIEDSQGGSHNAEISSSNEDGKIMESLERGARTLQKEIVEGVAAIREAVGMKDEQEIQAWKDSVYVNAKAAKEAVWEAEQAMENRIAVMNIGDKFNEGEKNVEENLKKMANSSSTFLQSVESGFQAVKEAVGLSSKDLYEAEQQQSLASSSSMKQDLQESTEMSAERDLKSQV